MSETFWGILWGFIGGAVLTVIGSFVIAWITHWFEGKRDKTNRERILRQLLDEIRNSITAIEEKSGASGYGTMHSFVWPSLAVARQTGALGELPGDTRNLVLAAAEYLEQVKKVALLEAAASGYTVPKESPILSANIVALSKKAEFQDLKETFAKAVEELKKYLDC